MSRTDEMVLDCAKIMTEGTSSGADCVSGSVSLERKQAWALPLWCAFVLAVLAVLWLQMQTKVPGYNFLIETNAAAEGAEAFLDGRLVGRIGQTRENGVQSFICRVQVPDGTHQLTLKKPGFKSVSASLNSAGSTYCQMLMHFEGNAISVDMY